MKYDKLFIFIFLTLSFLPITFCSVYAQGNRIKEWREKLRSRKQQELPYTIPGATGNNTYYQEENLVSEIITILDKGGRVDWTSDNTVIFFDSPGEDLWSANIDGSDRKCLTRDKTGLTLSHAGNPTVHPADKYIIFQAADPNLAILPPILEFGAKQHTSPGAGINNNLWCMDFDTNKIWQLTRISAGQGIIHPHFSKDGKKVIWAEKIGLGNDAWGNWAIKIADFKIQSSQPALNNIQTLKPGDFQ